MRLIDADALYEKTAEWEARALAVVEKLNSKPLGEMDVNEITEWRKWSCVLNERSAFKHDVADAPTIEPPQWIPVTERLPEDGRAVLVYEPGNRNIFLGIWMDDRWVSFDPGDKLTWFDETDYCDIVAWMPLPSPYIKGGES